MSKKVGSTPSIVETYKSAVRKNFSFLKETTRIDDAYAKSIPLADDAGFLLPLCRLHLTDEALIRKLSAWRESNASAFPTQFPVTGARTAEWLTERVLGAEDRMLFLVMSPHGEAIGHMGFANSINDSCEMEIDSAVRGVPDTERGIMSKATTSLLEWARTTIGPDRIHLRVFSDNTRAAEFYRTLGFVDDAMQPMRKHADGDDVIYRPVEPGDGAEADRHLLRMRYEPDGAFDGATMILTAGPSISAREASYALDAARYGWNNEWSKYLKRFEDAFAEYIGVKHALSTSCCTGSLHLALLALGVGPGDEVIVPDTTWVASATAVTYVGATPIFADVEPDSWCLDPDSFESLIGERTKAVIPVHLYGHPARMDRIMEIARAHGLFVVEDAAPAIGATFEGRKTGTFGDFAAFSFQGAKLVVSGEGGMLVTNDDALYEKVYSFWDQGRTPGTFWINELGLKYKMSNVQAAIGLGQLERVDELVEAKRRVFSWYAEGLNGVKGLRLMQETARARSIYWMSNVLVEDDAGIARDDLCAELKKRNIDTRPVFPAISLYPIWPKPQEPKPVSLGIGERGINLPSGVCLKREQVDYVCRMIAEVLAAG